MWHGLQITSSEMYLWISCHDGTHIILVKATLHSCNVAPSTAFHSKVRSRPLRSLFGSLF